MSSLLSALLLTTTLLGTAQVGPQAMPCEIEPLEAPFEMPSFERPAFPMRTVTVRLRSGELSTERIQQAIDRTSRRGGGTVVIPAGVWQTGRISLKSGVNLYLSEGAELHFSGMIKDYQPAVFTRDEGVELYSLGAFIYADGQENIALTGRGKVVGPSTDCEIYRRNQDANLDGLQDVLPEKRVFDGKDGTPVFLPKTFAPINCRDVFVEGITFDRGLYWNIVPQYCEHVVIRGCTVTSFGHGRTDGIDIDSCKDVLIEYCSLDDQDDCYTFKSGRGEDGRRVNRPTENVVIRRSLALRGGGGIVFGTEIAGGVRNVYLCDCVFDGTDRAFRFKTRRPRGGFVENVWIECVRAKVLYQAFVSEMLGSTKWVGELAHRYPAREITPLTPYFRNISIHDVQIDSCRTLVDVAGLPEMPVRNVFFGNVTGRCRQIGSVRDAVKFSLKDIRVESPDSVLTIDNVDYATFFGVSNVSTEQPVRIEKLAGDCKYLNIQEYPLHPVTYDAIRPGEVWLDTEGKPIQAHGFQVVWRDGKYWWYGEDKTETLFGTNRFFCGVRCYSSEDFYNWKDEGRIVVPDADPASPLHCSQKLERPHILHCPATGRWVCWLKAQANDGYFVVLEADAFTGPYRYVRSLKPCGFAVGDFDMYSDPETGKGYVWFERPHWENICAELSEEYTDVNGEFSEHFVGLTPPLTREAAAHFVRDGRHYIYTSGTTSYTPNPSEVAVFDEYHGEYTVLGNPHVGDEYAHSFCSQISSVIRIPGTDLYVAMADRWQPWTWQTDIPKREYASFLARYKDHQPFPRDFGPVTSADRRHVLVNQSQDVYSATYVFLPVVWKDGVPTIEWQDEWRLEDYLGKQDPAWDDTSRAEWGPEFEHVGIPSSTDGSVQQAIIRRSSGPGRPLVVSLHTWSGGYTQKDPVISQEALELDWNYIHPDFRGPNWTPQALGSPLAIQDIEDAIRWAVREMEADPDEVHVVGVSGGGYATLYCYMNLEYPVRSFSAWAPISDIEAWYWQTMGAGRNYWEHIRRAIPSGDGIDTAEAARRSPLYQALPKGARRQAPLHIYEGVHDGYQGSVPITHALLIYDRVAGEMKYKTSDLQKILDRAANDPDLVGRDEMLDLVTRQQNPDAAPSRELLGRQIHLELHWGPVSVTIFEGAHEQLPGALRLIAFR